jgi:Alpha-L-rhamnosidase N-terminal domain
VSINDTGVDDHVLKPGLTSYIYRTVHDTTDVTALLQPGRNAIGVRFAGAWATERFGFRTNARRVYADQPAVAVQLRIDYVDGRRTEVHSDGSGAPVPVRCSPAVSTRERSKMRRPGIAAGPPVRAHARVRGGGSCGLLGRVRHTGGPDDVGRATAYALAIVFGLPAADPRRGEGQRFGIGSPSEAFCLIESERFVSG